MLIILEMASAFELNGEPKQVSKESSSGCIRSTTEEKYVFYSKQVSIISVIQKPLF